ncbi:Hpt domain-containing protein [Massilia sp. Se16.2.3]|uniref:Hpt domain-containing protein n=1 Tax=Massilia sp. Se16.2.3 TaxID=2709303 RepID=UPI001E3F49BF|nr:Hpt domain-containing protein [Massilia sp. Se16.2.3]
MQAGFFARLMQANETFRAGLPGTLRRLQDVRAGLDPAAPAADLVAELGALLHTLAGAAATFGFSRDGAGCAQPGAAPARAHRIRSRRCRRLVGLAGGRGAIRTGGPGRLALCVARPASGRVALSKKSCMKPFDPPQTCHPSIAYILLTADVKPLA